MSTLQTGGLIFKTSTHNIAISSMLASQINASAHAWQISLCSVFSSDKPSVH